MRIDRSINNKQSSTDTTASGGCSKNKQGNGRVHCGRATNNVKQIVATVDLSAIV